MSQLNRRAFLAAGTAVCGCGLAPHAFAGAPALTPRLRSPDHRAVQLGDGPLKVQRDHNQSLYMAKSDDDLLKPFRVKAGQPAPGADMGGWYDASSDFHVDPDDKNPNWHGFIPGHSFGQYMSGLARNYATTGDPATKAKLTALVDGYAATISPRFFDDYNLPCYTYDKLVVGLMDAWYYAGVDSAKPALAKLTEAALPYLPAHAETRDEAGARPHTRQAQTWDESYTLPENLFLAWQRGMGDQYKALASRYIADEQYFGPLSDGKSPLQGLHAYSHVNGLSSAMQTYLTLGDEKYLRAAHNGFAFIEAQSFATGGWGRNESLLAADDTQSLFDSLTSAHASFETPCGVYGHFKIARYLLSVTGDSHYGDSMERILYNTVLGALPTQADGRTFYYSDYTTTAAKAYRGEAWPCCSGTFAQLSADYGISAYMVDADALYVNLYIPSRIEAVFGKRKIALSQQTLYPFGNVVRMTVSADRPAKFGLKLRIPAWAGPGTQVTVNGQAVALDAGAGHFNTVTRTWRDGDVVELQLDMTLRTEPLNAAHPEMVALMTGPLALFPMGDGTAPLSQAELLSARQTSGDWSIAAADRTVKLKPFAAIAMGEPYRLYSQLKV